MKRNRREKWMDDGCYYIDYKNGKCIRDGWTVKKDNK